jgi:hypothetical protein
MGSKKPLLIRQAACLWGPRQTRRYLESNPVHVMPDRFFAAMPAKFDGYRFVGFDPDPGFFLEIVAGGAMQVEQAGRTERIAFDSVFFRNPDIPDQFPPHRIGP